MLPVSGHGTRCPGAPQEQDMLKTDKTLDIQGVHEARAWRIVEETLHGMEEGRVLRVMTNSRAAKASITALCDRMGCSLAEFREEGGTLVFAIRRKPQDSVP